MAPLFAWRDVTSTAIAAAAGLLAIGVFATRGSWRRRPQGSTAEAPVVSNYVLRPQPPVIPREAISPPPAETQPVASPQVVMPAAISAESMPVGDLVPFDPQELERRRRETADVQQRLAMWTAQPPSVAPPSASESASILDQLCELLEEDFRQFARAIWVGPHPWAPEAFAALAHSHGVMPNDGFDRINAAAVALTGERLLEEVDGRVHVATGASSG